MAFRDQKLVMYQGRILVTYLDKPHMYFVQKRVNFGTEKEPKFLPIEDPKAWGKKWRPKGTTTLLGDTLEKKGLQLWPMGLALAELFGFYGKFTGSDGNQVGPGFSKDKGTLWGKQIFEAEKETLLELVLSASKAHTRAMKKGADIGSYVHQEIELFITAPMESHFKKGIAVGKRLSVDEYEQGQLWWDAQEAGEMTVGQEKERDDWWKIAKEEVELAQVAFDSFCAWWLKVRPEVVEAELIVYSEELDYSGAFDGLFKIKPEFHPVYKDWDRPILVMEDHKTSKASKEAPEGVYYSYIWQMAAYAKAYFEMTGTLVDDFLVVSARKDGEFSTIYLSELGMTVPQAMEIWEAVVRCYRGMEKIKAALLEHAEGNIEQATASRSTAASKG